MRISVLIALGVVALSLGACSGGSAPLTIAGEIDNAGGAMQPADNSLADIAAPRAVSVGDSMLDVSSGTRSYLMSTAVYFAPDQEGISQDTPDFMITFAPTTPERLTHTFFPLFGPLDDLTVSLGQVSLDMEWHGAVPGGNQGMYVGIPDYERDVWVWRGPAQSTADLLDFSSLGLTGNPADFAFDKVALVNYSDVEVKLKYFNFTTLNPADRIGDEQLFFITNNAGNFAINSATTAGLDSTSQIVSGGPGVELANLKLLDLYDGPLLIFDRREAGGNWEVWQSNLDGSGMQVRYSGASDVRFSVATPDNSFEFTLEGNGPDYYSSLMRHEPGSATAEMMREIPGNMEAAGYWYGNNSNDIAFLSAGLDSDLRQNVMLYTWSSFSNNEYYVPMVSLGTGESAMDPFYFTWQDGTTFSPRLTLYSAATYGSDTNEIRAHFLSQPSSMNNKTFVGSESFNLRYPSVSPDNKLLSVVACEPGRDLGMLVVQSSFLRELDASGGIADNVVGTPAWYDPTPPVFE